MASSSTTRQEQARVAERITRTFGAAGSSRSRAGMGAPLRRLFVRLEDGADAEGKPPLAGLLSGREASGGGRGGRVRVALYLTLLWVAAGGDHSSERPWRVWAQLVGLDDPAGTGTRSVRAAATELAARQFIHLTPGTDTQSAKLQLAREDGQGLPYDIPTGRGWHEQYLRVPEKLWTNGLLARLSGPELAMYLVSLDAYDSRDPERELQFGKSRVGSIYKLGDSTRRAGLNGLTERDVLELRYAAVDDSGSQLGRTRRRNLYVLQPTWRPPVPAHNAEPASNRD